MNSDKTAGPFTVTVVTLFPEMISGSALHSMLGRAVQAGVLIVNTVNPRDFCLDKHKVADDYPFGGGAGMVMKVEPLVLALESIADDTHPVPVIYMSPSGQPFTQTIANELAQATGMVLVCGHYEGIDERVRSHWIDREISLGDYVITGGEPAAVVIMDAVARLRPGVLGNDASPVDESFSDGTLEYPQFTRPADFRGLKVPDILLSGHHANISSWRRTQALVRTRLCRPDLWQKLLPLSKEDRKRIDTFDNDLDS